MILFSACVGGEVHLVSLVKRENVELHIPQSTLHPVPAVTALPPSGRPPVMNVLTEIFQWKKAQGTQVFAFIIEPDRGFRDPLMRLAGWIDHLGRSIVQELQQDWAIGGPGGGRHKVDSLRFYLARNVVDSGAQVFSGSIGPNFEIDRWIDTLSGSLRGFSFQNLRNEISASDPYYGLAHLFNELNGIDIRVLNSGKPIWMTYIFIHRDKLIFDNTISEWIEFLKISQKEKGLSNYRTSIEIISGQSRREERGVGNRPQLDHFQSFDFHQQSDEDIIPMQQGQFVQEIVERSFHKQKEALENNRIILRRAPDLSTLNVFVRLLGVGPWIPLQPPVGVGYPVPTSAIFPHVTFDWDRASNAIQIMNSNHLNLGDEIQVKYVPND